MGRTERIVCDCGGELSRPIPARCPHCGAVIGQIRHSVWPLVLPGLAIAMIFAAVVAWLLWWAT